MQGQNGGGGDLIVVCHTQNTLKVCPLLVKKHVRPPTSTISTVLLALLPKSHIKFLDDTCRSEERRVGKECW